MKILPILRAQFDLFLFTIVSHRLNSIWWFIFTSVFA
jgi:hypothetical protein